MKHVKLLDCTLRDGAYLLDKKFGENTIKGIIKGLMDANLDIIEVGFFQDDGFGDGKTVYKNSSDVKKFIPKDKKNAMFTVLADYSRYSIDNLDECQSDSIDAVRECFFKKERFDAIKVCKKIKEKGYKVFVQPVDILGYTDMELIEFINMINEIEPYCLSIVDTFGSMYQEDLHRVFELINNNLVSTCKIGFHSHNNMQLSNALSQEFIRMTYGKREVVVDSTISGMGRGAGNTPTELVMQYMISHLNYNYNMDALLDVIDDYMDNIKAKCSWGYSTAYFVAGCYSAHVNNVQYLTKMNTIRSKDMRYILNKIGSVSRKRYDYDLLEKTYVDYLAANIDDSITMKNLYKKFNKKNILVLVPGNSINENIDKIKKYINDNNSIVVSVNFLNNEIKSDYIYMNNVNRYSYWKEKDKFKKQDKIIASNIKQIPSDSTENIVSFTKLIKCGWENMDNSTILLLRLLDYFDVKTIAIAGFDGYEYSINNNINYVDEELELSNVRENPKFLNEEIYKMLEDYTKSRKSNSNIVFITNSKFEQNLKK